MLSLSDAIAHCEEVAEAEEQKYKDWKGDYSHLKKIDSCLECAKDHRQLAEWLRELKRDREVLTELDAAIECYENCECCQGFREYPTSRFIKDVIRINKEANADDTNRCEN